MNETILQTLKDNPSRNIQQVARLLGVNSLDVSKVQHAHLKKFRKWVSPLWNQPNYGKYPKPKKQQ